MTDRPSNSEAFQRLRETGVHGAFSSTPTPEESERIEEEGNVAQPTKYSNPDHETSHGTGSDTFDMMLDEPESVSPEDLIVLKEFLTLKHRELLDEEGNYDPDKVRDLKEEYEKWQEEPETEEEWEIANKRRDEKERKAEVRRKEEEKKIGFHLVLRPKALEKVATDEEQKKTREFLRTWNGNDGPVLWAGLELGKSKDDPRVRAITGVSVVVEKDGKMARTTIDAHIFRNVFEGVMGSKKPGTDITNGLEFVNPDSGERQKLYPGKTPDEVAEVLSQVKIGGISLPPETKYFIGNDNQKEKE